MSSRSASFNRLESASGYKEEAKHNKRARTLINVANMLFFGFSVVLIIVGILYLTLFRYEYTLTTFSITLIASFFLAVGVLVFVLSIANAVSIYRNEKKIILLASLIILVLFFVLLGIGIWGLAANSTDGLLNETKRNIQDTMRNYDEKNTAKYETRKIDW
jgi:uncharacterized protein YacL